MRELPGWTMKPHGTTGFTKPDIAIFAFISAGVLEGESSSTQISGA
jgi:hypothetical protein